MKRRVSRPQPKGGVVIGDFREGGCAFGTIQWRKRLKEMRLKEMRTAITWKTLLWVVIALAMAASTACATAAQPTPTSAPKAQPKTEATKAPEASKAPETSKAPEKAAAPAASKPAELTKIRLALLKGTQIFPVMVMLEQGFDKKYGIEVVKKDAASPDAINILMRSKEADACFNGWTETVKFRAQGVKLINTYPLSAFVNAVITKKDSPLKTLDDVKGKRLGVFYNPSTITAGVLRVSTLKYNGYDAYKHTEVREGAKPLIIGFLDKGDIDAIYLGEPDIANLMGSGKYKSIATINDIYKSRNQEVPLQLVVEMYEEFAEKNPQAAKGFAAALQDSVNYLKTHPEAWPKLTKELDITEQKSVDLLRESLTSAYVGKSWDKKSIDTAVEFGKELRKTIGADFMPDTDYSESFTMKYLP